MWRQCGRWRQGSLVVPVSRLSHTSQLPQHRHSPSSHSSSSQLSPAATIVSREARPPARAGWVRPRRARPLMWWLMSLEPGKITPELSQARPLSLPSHPGERGLNIVNTLNTLNTQYTGWGADWRHSRDTHTQPHTLASDTFNIEQFDTTLLKFIPSSIHRVPSRSLGLCIMCAKQTLKTLYFLPREHFLWVHIKLEYRVLGVWRLERAQCVDLNTHQGRADLLHPG